MEESAMHAIIMAGGKGTRLRDIIGNQPKVLAKLDHEYDILGVLIEQLGHFGFNRITVCVSYLAEAIKSSARCLSGAARIEYCLDQGSTGTAGPLLGVAAFTDPALVINGDVLTTMDFADLYATHMRRQAALTVAAVRVRLPVEYGVLEYSCGRVTGIAEKPGLDLVVNGGVYAVSPRVLSYLAADSPMDMPELMTTLIQADEVVAAQSFDGPWYELGTPAGLASGRAAFGAERERFVAPPSSSVSRRFFDLCTADPIVPGRA